MNSTFKQFQKLKIPLIMEINKVLDNKKDELDSESDKNLSDYRFCVVGTIRQRLGLSDEYEFMSDPGYCKKCHLLAGNMPNPIWDYISEKSFLKDELNYIDKFHIEQRLKEYKEQYEVLLLELKQHLKLDHNKVLA